MPNIDSLMQIWTPEFEELLKEVSHIITNCYLILKLTI